VAFGLASGFVEPLESTSIHMIMTAAVRLAHLFPFGGIKQPMIDQYNELSKYEIERIRDFVCMHYHYTQRDDTEFWRQCAQMEIPDSLRKRVELFRQGGYIYKVEGELFTVDSWVSVMMGNTSSRRPITTIPARTTRKPRTSWLTTARRWRRS